MKTITVEDLKKRFPSNFVETKRGASQLIGEYEKFLRRNKDAMTTDAVRHLEGRIEILEGSWAS